MENLTELLAQLAEQLGTTSEYLWGVLINQARVYAISSSLEILGMLIIGYALYRAHKKLSAPIEIDDHGDNYGDSSLYDRYEEAVIAPMVIGALIWSVMFLISFFIFSNIITAIVNPEYWALKTVMELIN